ncbi:alpha/beta hydrolase [Streptomyces sp. BE20]|uniref:alpha/beta fold hydrolase n=1 Tax=Streptomycetaceae TaxID=2062 RepID=UPI002E7AACFA|nr:MULTISPECIES: alpha/beta hydrolase [unclassified Streptomyces]MED7951642.1 alpha/beta hydrolase [Streptomyces sp. BE303]MEE1829021.1 alpha/beta hydrolase [Streptomyces sp. BE20]
MTIPHRLIGTGAHKVLVLHDWFGTSAGWGPFLDYLDGSAFTYAFLDYRGYGERRNVAGAYTLAEIADDALALADQLGWESFSLVGHSMGGKAVQQVLAQAPGRVRKLVGLAPVPASVYPMDAAAEKLFYGAAEDREKRFAIIDLVTGRRAGRVWLDLMVNRSLSLSTREAFGGYVRDWATADLVERIDGNPVPVKVIVGAHDLALTAEVMRGTFLTHYPNAELEELPNSGHYPMHETPVALAASLESFLRG